MPRILEKCTNFADLRDLARRRLPSPIFHYIDGAADDEVTYRRNSMAFEDCDLVPNVLAGVEEIDMSVEVMGFKLSLPIFCSPTALQRLFHYEGERAVALAAHKYNTLFGVSSLGTVPLKEIGELIDSPKMFQFYFHKDKALNDAMIEMATEAKFDVLTLTVDTITGGNRERDLRTGFTTPPKLTLPSLFQFGIKPAWAFNFLLRKKFELSQLKNHVKEGSNIAISVGDYFSTMLDQTLSWNHAEDLKSKWNGKGSLEVETVVTNTGNMAGAETIQLYIRDKFSSVTRPVLELKAYNKITLHPGESKIVSFSLTAESFAYYNIDMEYLAENGDFIIYTGSSSAFKNLKKASINLTQNIYFNEE